MGCKKRLIGYCVFGLSLVLHSWAQAQTINSDSLAAKVEFLLSENQFYSIDQVAAFINLTDSLSFNKPKKALFFTNKLDSLLSVKGDEAMKALVYRSKGNYFWVQGIYERALENYFAALELFEKQNNHKEKAKILNNIGETFKKQNDLKEAAKYLELSLDILKRNTLLQPKLILINLAQLYLMQDKLEQSRSYLEEVKLSLSDSTDAMNLGYYYLYLGTILKKQQKLDSANTALQTSIKYWDKSNYTRGLIESNTLLAEVHLSQQNYVACDSFISRSEADAKRIGSLDLLVNLYATKIHMQKAIRSYTQLPATYENYILYKDSLLNKEKSLEISRLRTQYEFAQQERRLMQLAYEQESIKSQAQSQRTILIVSAVALILALLFIYFLWRQRNTILDSNKLLQEQKKEIEKKQNEITEKSISLAKLNQELHELNKSLESKVTTRSKQLAQKNKQIAEYTFINSHKLRAPVASVLGLINVLELSEDDKLNMDIVKHLRKSALDLDRVIFNLKELLEEEMMDKDEND